MTLEELEQGNDAIIVNIGGSGAFRKRIIEMGFVKGNLVKSIKNAPLNDPIEYKIMDYYVSLRRSEASIIEVVKPDDAIAQNLTKHSCNIDYDNAFQPLEQRQPKIIRVALVGNPNCGKTTLYNYLCKANEHTGNYSGVTVGTATNNCFHKGYNIEFIDLPGTYSISAYSPEETFVRSKLIELDPDIVLNILDSANITRNLYLTSQLIDMGQRMVVALNMFDDLEKQNAQLNYNTLGRMLGTPMVPTVGNKGRGLNELLDKIIEVYEGTDHYARRIRINYGLNIEETIDAICKILNEKCTLPATINKRYMALKFIEGDTDFVWEHLKASDLAETIGEITTIVNQLKSKTEVTDLDTYLTDLRYGFIDGALSETYKAPDSDNIKNSRTQKIDHILTHQYWGIPLFVLIIWTMFQCTFSLGQYPMDWISQSIELFSGWLNDIMIDGPVKDLIISGIISGVGGVIVFLPNILILFLFISFMEDTGYMARAAFIMDRAMHRMGLHGKSFIPLIMGFGCNVPAVMASRTIEDHKNRMLTMLINPFMSCSARLPIYLLFCGAFFPTHAGTMLFVIYLFGIFIAILVCRLFKQFLFNDEKELPFVMELPPYRMPTIRSTLLNMWSRASQYLSKMGTIIMMASIIVWFLGYYPKNAEAEKQFEEQIKLAEEQGNRELADSISVAQTAAAQEYSFIGRIGKVIEPVLKPLGFDWRMSISLVAGVGAKEIVVSTLSVLYHTPDEERLPEVLKTEINPKAVIPFMLFTLLYFPCLATLTAIKNEAGYWDNFNTGGREKRKRKYTALGWAVFTATYTTIIAWIIAWIVYHLGIIV